MDGGARLPGGDFRVNPVDQLGRRMSAAVHDAAEQIVHRAILHSEKLHVDPAIAASLLEEAGTRVSRAIDRKRDRNEQPVRDLRAYLFRAFLRLINRAVKRQLLVGDAIRMLSVTSDNSVDPLAQLEQKILVDELLTRGDSVTRDMFYRRTRGFSWDEIGLSYGISGHAAESRFSQAIRRLAQKLDLTTNSLF
jgi:DNA-directed RNA polymerase specialized sigma24 family protein